MSVKRVFERITKNEVELSKAEIELGLVDSMQKMVSTSEKLEDKLRAASKEVDQQEKIKNDLEKQFEKARKASDAASEKFFKSESRVDPTLTKIDELLNKARRAANELGVSPSGVDGFKELEQARKGLSNARVGK